MSPRCTLATAERVLRQLRHDPRTIGLLLAVPCVLQIIMHELFRDRSAVFQSLGVPLLGLFPFVTMFLVTSVAMLRERTSGTLERLLTTPLAKLDLLLGYALAKSPSAMPRTALAIASRTTATELWPASRPRSPNEMSDTSVACIAATSANAIP